MEQNYKELVRQLKSCAFTVISPELAGSAATAIQLLTERLAAYEDTGLTPQEIEQMKARMPLHQWAGESVDKMSIFGVSVKKIMEWAEAEKQTLRGKDMKSDGVQDVFEWLEQKCKDQKKEVDKWEELCRGSWGFLYRDGEELLRAKERLQAYVDIKIGVEKYMKKLRHQGE